MGKQKIVMKLTMEDAKRRSKAMKIAVNLPGIISVSVEGEAKDRLVVVGDGIDSFELMKMLRKKMGYVELVSVAAVQDGKENKDPNKQNNEGGGGGGRAKNPPQQQQCQMETQYIYLQDPKYEPSCSVM